MPPCSMDGDGLAQLVEGEDEDSGRGGREEEEKDRYVPGLFFPPKAKSQSSEPAGRQPHFAGTSRSQSSFAL